jgi:hypothetical protein
MTEKTIEIEIDGKTEILKRHFEASKKISAYFGGMLPALNALAQFNVAAYSTVIAAGLNKKADDVERELFQTDLLTLTGPLSDYIALLMGGEKAAREGV